MFAKDIVLLMGYSTRVSKFYGKSVLNSSVCALMCTLLSVELQINL